MLNKFNFINNVLFNLRSNYWVLISRKLQTFRNFCHFSLFWNSQTICLQ